MVIILLESIILAIPWFSPPQQVGRGQQPGGLAWAGVHQPGGRSVDARIWLSHTEPRLPTVVTSKTVAILFQRLRVTVFIRSCHRRDLSPSLSSLLS